MVPWNADRGPHLHGNMRCSSGRPRAWSIKPKTEPQQAWRQRDCEPSRVTRDWSARKIWAGLTLGACKAGHGGVIINLVSITGYRAAGPGICHYVSSKHGVRGLTKSLAVELGPHGIRVLAAAPGITDTPGLEEGRAAFRAAGLGDLLEQMAQREPLGRVGVPDDVARVVLFCASDLAILMTGSTLLVDAGDVAV